MRFTSPLHALNMLDVVAVYPDPDSPFVRYCDEVLFPFLDEELEKI